MYTGIIKGCMPVTSVNKKEGLIQFSVELTEDLLVGIQKGNSVGLDGVCVTVVRIDGHTVTFDIMQETIEKTTLGKLVVGRLLNVERSAKMGDEIGGHPMSGHIYGMAEIISIDEPENNTVMTFKVPKECMKFIFNKGFIGLDGCSLTVVDPNKEAGTFKVWFIPETLVLTAYGTKKVGDMVNLELDAGTQTIVETVERIMKKQ